MSREQRSTMWAIFAAAALQRTGKPASSAIDADAMLKEFDKRFRDCHGCNGRGWTHGQSGELKCETCKGSGYLDNFMERK